MARGSELARGPLLGLKLSSISSSWLVSRLSSAHLGLDSALPGWVPGDRLGYAAETTLDLVRFFGCCNHEKYATSSGSRIFFLQTDFILFIFFIFFIFFRHFFRPRFFVYAFALLVVFVAHFVRLFIVSFI